MRVIADLHIHSAYSRATSKKLSPPYLDRWARIKGIGLLGSGDCTHPKWLEELRESFDDAEDGFYTLKKKARKSFDTGAALADDLPEPLNPSVENSGAGDTGGVYTAVRYVLTGEISTIYKQGDKTRKIHHLVILPGFSAAAAFQIKLEQVGNIRSDGRPILGISSHDLLSILLETDDRSILVPAHIWTPWFSALGAKSGFDSIAECYGDLTSFIPAVETGLSSNPAMNWSLQSLDAFSIISNSDAHSPDKLGREATVLEMDMSYESFSKALKLNGKSNGIAATIEFFPHEGKYHYDGHRNCQVCLGPEEAHEREYICPVCNKPLTPGVMSRVLELADRPVDESASCPKPPVRNCRPYYSLIPLKEILGELLGTGPSSKKVEAAYKNLIENAGSELSILMDLHPEKIEDCDPARLFRDDKDISRNSLAEAICRMRRGEVFISPGYDGEYGVIRAFKPESEKSEGKKQRSVKPESKLSSVKNSIKISAKHSAPKNTNPEIFKPEFKPNFKPNIEQKKIIESKAKNGLVIAGPGTGKTAVLAAKISALVNNGVPPSAVLALSFTVKAAGELRERIAGLVTGAENSAVPAVSTFHSLCASILREQYEAAGLAKDFKILDEKEKKEILKKFGSKRTHENYIDERKRYLLLPGDEPDDLARFLPSSVYAAINGLIPEKIKAHNKAEEASYSGYRNYLRENGLVDYEGLISGAVRLFASKTDILRLYQQKWKYIFVDEYQDLNFAQYVLVRLFAHGKNAPSLWVIGDPNQAIYGFRGSDKAFIDRFRQDFPGADEYILKKSFRCAEPIVKAAGLLARTDLEGRKTNVVNLYRRTYSTEKSEAEGIARTIASLVGGTGFFAMDSGAVDGGLLDCSPEDCAVLVRASALAEPIIKALKDHGIPFETAETAPWWETEPAASILAILKECESKTERGSAPEADLSANGEIIRVWKSINNAKQSTAEIFPESVMRLLYLARIFGTVQALLDGLSFGTDLAQNSALPGSGRGVKVMTIHASKGLEFDHVFIPALEEGILPFTLFNDQDIEEERRLLYVAMTRARTGLWLSNTGSRFFRGRVLKPPASRFLSELENIIPLVKDEKPRKEKPRPDLQMTLF